MKTKRLIAFIASLFFVLHGFSQMKSGDNVIISEKMNHDLYVAGGTVTINASVQGDLIVAGGTIIVNDTITQDILVAGGTVIFNGYVGDDIRCGGGKIRLSSNVAGDVVATGGTINIDEGVTIGGNLLSAGGEVILDGEVRGVIKSASGTFTLNGNANDDIDCRGGKIFLNGTVNGNSILSANTIEIGPNASLNKDVKYWNKEGSLDFKNALHGGQATFDTSLEMEDGRWHYLGFTSLLIVLWYLGTAFIMTLLIHYLFSRTLKNAANTVKTASLKSLGLGFLFLIGLPVIIVISFVTIVGIPVGILMLIGYGTILMLGTVIVALVAANWINNTNYQSSWSGRRLVLTSFGIFIFLKLASLTPFVGPLIMLLLSCMAFGGILQNVKWRRNKALELT